MGKIGRGLLMLAFLTANAVSAGSLDEKFQARVQQSADVSLMSAFYPSPLPEKSGYDTEVYDDYVRITQRIATVDFPGEAQQRYLASAAKADPVLDAYLGVAIKRGGKVKVYKGILNQKLFGVSGARDFWSQNRKMANEDQAFLEYDATGRLRSGLIRRAVFSNGSLGIGVYRETFVLTGVPIRSIENQLSNTELADTFLREVTSQ